MIAALSLALAASITAAQGDLAAIPWSMQSSGGGPSAGGAFELRGVVGERGAAWMTGGNYRLAGLPQPPRSTNLYLPQLFNGN